MKKGIYILAFSVIITFVMFFLAISSMYALRSDYKLVNSKYELIKNKYICESGIYIQASKIDKQTWGQQVSDTIYDLYTLDNQYLDTIFVNSPFYINGNFYKIESYSKNKSWRKITSDYNHLKQFFNFIDSYKPID